MELGAFYCMLLQIKRVTFLEIGEILRNKQPDVYKKLIKFSNTNNKKKVKKDEYVDFKRLMEDAPTYKRHHGAWRQVRNGQ
jgi:hypothetical protein